MPRTLFIINPEAGGGKGMRRWQALRGCVAPRVGYFEEHFTSRSGEVAEVAKQAIQAGFDTLVAVGGDGTLNEAINGIIVDDQLASPYVTLGYLGAGSSNDFLRTVGRTDAAPPLSHPCSADVGRIECRSASGERVIRYFLLNSSIGVISKAVEIF